MFVYNCNEVKKVSKIINEMYVNLIANSANFRQFVEDMEKYTTEEIIAEYGLKNSIICPCSGPLEKPA